jgi:hypothetical protein
MGPSLAITASSLGPELPRLLAIRDWFHDLAQEAREENPTYSLHMADAATDNIDRDVFLGLASFEQESLYEIDALWNESRRARMASAS